MSATAKCYLFVDDSNIWIEAQKAAAAGIMHLPELKDADRDPRLRIDLGSMRWQLLNGRYQGDLFTYGSRPPFNDSVWKSYEKQSFTVRVFNRDRNNKEKEVDTAMCADMSEKATELRVRAQFDSTGKSAAELGNAVFVVVSGDRDIIPAIEKVLNANIPVEVWGWGSGLAEEYYSLEKSPETHGLLSVNHLEQIAKWIFFTETRSTHKGPPNPSLTVVICNLDDEAETGIDEAQERLIIDELYQSSRIFYTRKDDLETVLIVEFPNIRSIEPVINALRERFHGRYNIKSYLEYQNTAKRTSIIPSIMHKHEQVEQQDPDVKLISTPRGGQGVSAGPAPGLAHWKELPAPTQTKSKAMTMAESITSGLEADPAGWQSVTKPDRVKEHQRSQERKQSCRYGVRCSKRGECGRQHTAEERRKFQDVPSWFNMKNYKSTRCHNKVKGYCVRGHICFFAHNDDEAWCLDCRFLGHCRDDCPKSSS